MHGRVVLSTEDYVEERDKFLEAILDGAIKDKTGPKEKNCEENKRMM